MENTSNYIKKFTASLLAVICLSMPFTGIAAAAKHEPPPPPKHNDHHWNDRHDKDKDENGNAVTGFIIGAVVGAVVAKNT